MKKKPVDEGHGEIRGGPNQAESVHRIHAEVYEINGRDMRDEHEERFTNRRCS